MAQPLSGGGPGLLGFQGVKPSIRSHDTRQTRVVYIYAQNIHH